MTRRVLLSTAYCCVREATEQYSNTALEHSSNNCRESPDQLCSALLGDPLITSTPPAPLGHHTVLLGRWRWRWRPCTASWAAAACASIRCGLEHSRTRSHSPQTPRHERRFNFHSTTTQLALSRAPIPSLPPASITAPPRGSNSKAIITRIVLVILRLP
jgi:hypothetical protein